MADDAPLTSFVASLIAAALALAPAGLMAAGAGFAARYWRWLPPGVVWPLGLALLAGIALGVAVIAAGPMGPALSPSEVFDVRGPWDLSAHALMAQRVPDALRGVPWLMATPLALLPPTAKWAIAALLVFGGAAGVIAFACLPVGAAVRLLAVAAVVALTAMAGLVYLLCLVPWVLHVLNFWALGLLCLAFVYWRRGSL